MSMNENDIQGTINVDLNEKEVVKDIGVVNKALEDLEKKVKKTTQSIEKTFSDMSKKVKAQLNAVATEGGTTTQQMGSRSRARVAKLAREAEARSIQLKGDVNQQAIGSRTAGNLSIQSERTKGLGVRALGNLSVQEAKTLTKVVEGEQRRTTLNLDNELKRQRFIYRQHAREVRTIEQQVTSADRFRAKNPGYEFFGQPSQGPSREQPYARRLRLAEDRRVLLEQRSVERQVAAADKFRAMEQGRQRTSVQGQVAAADRFRTLNPGYMFDGQPVQGPMPEMAYARSQRLAEDRRVRLEQESTQRQIREADRFRTRNPNYANMRGGGGGGGFFGGVGRRLAGIGGGGASGMLAGGLAAGFGVTLGAAAIGRGVGATVEAVQLATAYDRQSVASEKLAGSQENLNALLDAYTKASGGAVDKSTTLSNVTRLLATGFAKSVPEVERFVRATRGASIALGKPQDYVIQETQLAISNTSQKRLDQIGLGIKEVTDRIEELRVSNANWSRETAFQESVLSLMEEKYGALTQTVQGQATEVEKLTKAWNDLFLSFGQNSGPAVNAISRFLTKLITPEAGVEGRVQDKAIQRDINFSKPIFGRADSGVTSAFELWGMLTGRTGTQIRAQHALDSGMFNRGPRGDMPDSSGTIPALPGMSEDERELRRSSYEAVQQVESQANKQRLQEIENYEQQRESIIISYGTNLVRSEQDFARQRARGLRDYEKSILDIMRNAQKRETEMQEDLDDTISDATEQTDKRITDLNEKYNKDREKAEKQHQENMMKAVGQLDAIAVLEERKRWKLENKERKEGHDDALADAQENLQEQIEKAKEAHAERLEDAREADAERLQEMASDRKQQLADEDEDKEIRDARAAEDHQKQLNELDRQHVEALTRIQKEADEQTKILEDALLKDLAAINVYVAGYLAKIAEHDKAIDDWFDKLIERLEKEIKDEKIEADSKKIYHPGGGLVPAMAGGGSISRTGLAMLHAGEYVVPAAQVASNNSSQYNSSSRIINIQPNAINIYTTPGMEEFVGNLVEEKMLEIIDG